MSIALMSAAWELDLPQTEKMVLLCLCDFANDDGVCWPSREKLATKCSVTDRSVRRAITTLEQKGYVERHPRLNNSTIYKVNKALVGWGTQSPGGTESPEVGDTGSPKPSLNHQPKKSHAHELPANWEPIEFGLGTKCRGIVDGWPPGELETQIEHFTAHHRARGNKFKDWQDAWKTWVLGSRKFNNGDNIRTGGANRADRRSGLARAIDAELGSLSAFP